MALTKISTGMLKQDAASSDLNIDAGTLFLDVSNNRVGIAETSPSQKLQVNGNIRADGHYYVGGQIVIDSNRRILAADGAANVPYITFAADTNTGLYRPGTNILGFSTAGSERMRIDANGSVFISSTSDSGSNRHFFQHDGFFRHVRSGQIVGVFDRLSTDGNIVHFRKDGSDVGTIGVNAGRFYIHNNYGSGAGIRFDNASLRPSTAAGASEDATTDLGASAARFKDLYLSNKVYAAYIGAGSDTDTSINFDTANTVKVYTGGSERMRIDSSGNVGIGTTAPDQPLHVVGTRPLRLERSGVGEFEISIDNTVSGDSSDFVIEPVSGTNSAGFQVRTRNTGGSLIEAVNVNHDGQVGIGTDSPSSFVESSRFVVGSGASGTNEMMFLYSGTNTFGALGFADGTSGTEAYRGIMGYDHNTDTMFFSTAGGGNASRDMIIGSNGGVSIGTSTAAGSGGLLVNGISQFDNTMLFGSRGRISWGSMGGGTGFGIRAASGNALSFGSNGVWDKAIIDTSGNLLVATTLGYGDRLNINGTGHFTGNVTLSRQTNDSGSTGLILEKTRNTSVNGNTVVQNGDQLGYVAFRGNDGDQFIDGAYVISFVDGTPSNNDMPTNLQFWTTSDGASSPTERMRIDSSGRVGIGTNNPSNAKLEVVSASGEVFRADSASGAYRIVANQTGVSMQGTVSVAGKITASVTDSEFHNRLFVKNGTHGLYIGQWDGSNHRIEADANRPLTIQAYNSGGITLGISGNPKFVVTNAGAATPTKLAVMSSTPHGSYDFYNNGTSYFNGSVVVDDHLSITGSSAQLTLSRTSTDQTAGFNITNNQNGGYGSGIVWNSKRTDAGVLTAAEITVSGENAWNSDATSSSMMQFATRKDNTLTTHMTIRKSGNVGIGVTSPYSTLQVDGPDSAVTAHFGQGQSNSSGVFGGISLGYAENANSNYRKVAIVAKALSDGAARQNLHFLVDTVNDGGSAALADTKMMIDGLTGNVGIGTESPSAPLSLLDASLTTQGTGEGGLRVHRPNAASQYGYFDYGYNEGGVNIGSLYSGGGASSFGTFTFRQHSSTTSQIPMFIDSVGNVGIGNSNPNKPLTVTSDSGANCIALRARSANDYSFIQFFNNAGSALRGQIYSHSSGDIGFTTGTDSSAGTDLYIKNGAGVGIGTNSPGSYKLNVNGETKTLGLYSAGTTNLGTNGHNGSDKTILAGYGVLAGNGVRYGNYGSLIFKSSSAYTAGARSFLITNGYGANKFAIIQSSTHTTIPDIDGAGGGANNGTPRLVIDNSGLVGIGTTDPQETLQVDGNIRISHPDGGGSPAMTATIHMHGYESRGIGIKMRDQVNSASGASNREWFVGTGYNTSAFGIGYAQDGSQSSYNAQNKLTVAASGFVGIGTTGPAELLHVHNGSSTAAIRVSGEGNNNRKCQIEYNATDGPIIRAGSSGITSLKFTVDNSTLAGKFHTNADFYTNDGTVHSLSDIRVKTDVKDLADGLDIVKQLKPRTFRYTEDSEFYNESKKDEVSYGFVANEVEEVAPQYTSSGKGKIGDVEIDDLKSLSTIKMIPMLVKAIQEQQTLIESLTNRIATLEE